MANSLVKIQEQFRAPEGVSIPTVPNFDVVDVEKLTEGDDSPFYLTIAIAEVNRVSRNGLMYDDYLVSEIENQLKGLGGVRGHIEPGDLGLEYPIEALDWVGAVREGSILWGKAYFPPGPDRKFVQRLINRGGLFGTSIVGVGVQVVENAFYRVEDFSLESVDWVPWKSASLQSSGEVAITMEAALLNVNKDAEKGSIVMEETAVVASEEPIVEEQEAAPVEEVQAEVEVQEAVADPEIKRLREAAYLYGQVSAQFPDGTDVVSKIGSMISTLESMSELLGSPVDLQVGLREFMESHRRLQSERFDRELDDLVQSRTPWKSISENQKKLVESVRQSLRISVLSQLGESNRDIEAANTALSGLLEGTFKPIVEQVLSSLSGPSITPISTGQTASKEDKWKETVSKPEGRSQLMSTYRIPSLK